MRLIIYLFGAILLSSCAAVAVKKEVKATNKPTRTEIPVSFEQTWSKITNYLYTEGYSLKANNKDQGILTCELKEAFISYKDKEGKINNPTAYANF